MVLLDGGPTGPHEAARARTGPVAASDDGVARAGSGGTGTRVGLDLGGTKVHGVLVEDGPDGRVLAEVRVPTVTGPDGVVASAERAVAALREQAGGAAPASVGLALPGLVDAARGSVSHAVNLGIVAAEPVGPRLSARLGGVPVVVENDLNAAALGAWRLLGLTGDLAFLALGTGVAAGLVLDGRVRRGHRGAAGEVGHLRRGAGGPDAPLCACGQRGCLELVASGSALDAAWPTPDRPAPEALFDAAAAGDPAAVAVRDAYAEAVADAIWGLVLTVDGEHVVLGGGVAGVGRPLEDAVVAALRAREAGSAFLRTLGVPARLRLVAPGSLAAPLGAAAAAVVA